MVSEVGWDLFHWWVLKWTQPPYKEMQVAQSRATADIKAIRNNQEELKKGWKTTKRGNRPAKKERTPRCQEQMRAKIKTGQEQMRAKI
jgi:hypothetical protein